MIIPDSTLCLKCDKDVKDDDVKGLLGVGLTSHYVCQPCGEIYRVAELEFCTNYFKKENKDDTSSTDTSNNQ